MEGGDLSEIIEDLEGLGMVYPAAQAVLASGQAVRLGVDSCAVCGVAEHKRGEECVSCARIWYCSRRCRQQDAEVHEGLLCRALWQVGRDDDAELQSTQQHQQQLKKTKNKKKKQQIEANQEQEPVRESAALSRVASEVESYPNTLQYVLMTHTLLSLKGRSHGLVVHVIGASSAELPSAASLSAWRNAVVESAVASKKKLNELHFIGEELSDVQFEPSQLRSDHVQLHVWPITYESFMQQRGDAAHTPDLVCFFNPGFTCPDYEWPTAIRALVDRWSGVQYFASTNTKDEMLMDLDWLQGELGLEAMPVDLGGASEEAFFGDNPAAGRRIRQSGTMANDVYIKNRWLYGGVLSQSQRAEPPTEKKRKAANQKSTKQKEKRANR